MEVTAIASNTYLLAQKVKGNILNFGPLRMT